jgi:hypothetical protein
MATPSQLTLHHTFYCHHLDGFFPPPHHFVLLDMIDLRESNVAFELNGQVFRKGASLFSAHRSAVALQSDIARLLEEYLPRSISEFFTDLVLGNRLPSWRSVP